MATKRLRGFAAMDPARVREIARMGGKQAHKDGRAHTFTSDEAKAAGLKSVAARLAQRGDYRA
jgi:general stress protein YciG